MTSDRFTGDDRGKDVVTPAGNRVGTISSVDGDRATVERDAGSSIVEGLRAMLGWSDGDDSGELREEHVERSTEHRIYLRQH